MGDWDDIKKNGSSDDKVHIAEQVLVSARAKSTENLLFTREDVRRWATAVSSPESKICCLLYGADGTAKTGIVFSYLTDQDVLDGKQLWVIDLDGGGLPLKLAYHKARDKNLVVINPLETCETDEGTMIDYRKTFAKTRAIIEYVKQNWEKEKIKAIVFDGLSTALYHAEQQMRVEKNLDVDGGVQQRYWISRNKLFLETIELIKRLPIARFFIAHENFIIPAAGEKSDVTKPPSQVVAKTNAMMIQKVRCSRIVTSSTVEFIAVIDKNKYNVGTEGSRIEVCKVNKGDKSFVWKANEVIKVLGG